MGYPCPTFCLRAFLGPYIEPLEPLKAFGLVLWGRGPEGRHLG